MKHSSVGLWAAALILAAVSLAFAKAPAFPPERLQALLALVNPVNIDGVSYRLDNIRVEAHGEQLVVYATPRRIGGQ